MTLLGVGSNLRRSALQGFGASAKIEGQEQAQRQALENARYAQKMNTIGTGGGIGAMYGLKGLAASGAAPVATTTSTSAPILSTLASTSPEGGISVLKGLETAASMAPNTLGTTTATVGVGTGGGAVGGGAVGGGVAGGAGGAGAATTTAATTTGSGFLSGLATVAAPIAIGLGVAYLISELFD